MGFQTTAAASGTAELGPCSTAFRAIATGSGPIYVIGASTDAPFQNGVRSCDYRYETNPETRIVLIRLNAQGDVDESWANGGMQILPAGLWASAASATPDGGLLYVSGSDLIRLDANGLPAAGFGSGGVVAGIDSLVGASIWETAFDASGRVLLSAGGGRMARLEPDGTLDADFGTDGLVTLDTSIAGFAIDGLGRIVTTGNGGEGGNSLQLARLLEDGTLDVGFGPTDDGYSQEYKDPYAPIYAQLVSVQADGTIRAVNSGPGDYKSCDGKWSYLVFDDDGLFTGGDPVRVGCGLNDAVDMNDGTFGTAASANLYQPPSFMLGRDGGPGSWHEDVEISPGSSGAYSVDYLPGEDALLGAGFAEGSDCSATGCPTRTHIVLTKVEADTGKLIENFGVRGRVLLPGNRCVYGRTASSFQDRRGPWKRCRVEPPKFQASVKTSSGRRPALTGRVSIPVPPDKPGGLIQKIVLEIPKAFRTPKRGLRPGSVVVSADSPVEGEVVKKVKGRRIAVSFVPTIDVESDGPPDPAYVTNAPVSFRIKVKRGVLERVRRKPKERTVLIRMTARYETNLFGDARRFDPNQTNKRIRAKRK